MNNYTFVHFFGLADGSAEKITQLWSALYCTYCKIMTKSTKYLYFLAYSYSAEEKNKQVLFSST